MKPDLDKLQPEIEHYLEQAGLAVFYGYSRSSESSQAVYWDCDRYPNYRLFIDSARAAGARLIVFHQREFSNEQIDDALERLAGCEISSEDSQNFEQRLSELRIYDGSVCSIELSFDHQGRVFLFDLRTGWYQEFSEILDEIDVLTAEAGDDGSPISGYFSRN